MEPNNMLKHYLTIGFIISLIAILSSCDDGYYRYQRLAEYRFINETNHVITYPTGYERLNIAPKSNTIIKESVTIGGKETGAKISDYISPLSSHSATFNLIIKFNNEKCLINVKEDDINSVKNIKNFIAERIGENNYRFTYTFTEADYNRAITCP